jgi:hypothetical protein
MKFSNRYSSIFYNRKIFGNNSEQINNIDFQLYRYFYFKYKFSNGPKNLMEFKKLALEEAKKISTIIKNEISKKNKKKKKSTENEDIIIDKDILKKILLYLFNIINPLLTKLQLNFKNERRKYYKEEDKYLEIIKKYEEQKMNIITYAIKSICKMVNFQFSILQKNIFNYIERNDIDIKNIINSFSNLGKISVIAPKYITEKEVKDVLKTYYDNLKYMLENYNENEMIKFSFIFISDIIYENYGIEEEQIFSCIEEKNMLRNNEIKFYFEEIRIMMQKNLNILFDI